MTISAEILRGLLHYDAGTGIFTWCKKPDTHSRVSAGVTAGCIRPDGRVQISIRGKTYLAHRLAFLYVTGKWPEVEVDHKDTNPNNNLWSNLRDATRKINAQNKRAPHRNNKIGILGVRLRGMKFTASICIDGAMKHLGSFESSDEAHAKYLEAKRTVLWQPRNRRPNRHPRSKPNRRGQTPSLVNLKGVTHETRTTIRRSILVRPACRVRHQRQPIWPHPRGTD